MKKITIRIRQATSRGYVEVGPGGVFDGAYPSSKNRRGRVQEGGAICPTIATTNEIYYFEGVTEKNK
jgi:hypothetical protein